jgi:hypothetical protein
MNDQGRFTGWTGLLVLAGMALAITGALLAPATLPTRLLAGGWVCIMLALSSVYRKARAKAREQQIRDDERARLSGPGGRL